MSRLLFAAARGARIQTNDRGGCLDAAYIPTADYKGDDFRIHPDNAHLAYGPISTALLEMAKSSSRSKSDDTYWRMARDYVMSDVNYFFYWSENDFDRSLLYLILAEALADSGL
jgi:hypothetical protein